MEGVGGGKGRGDMFPFTVLRRYRTQEGTGRETGVLVDRVRATSRLRARSKREGKREGKRGAHPIGDVADFFGDPAVVLRV